MIIIDTSNNGYSSTSQRECVMVKFPKPTAKILELLLDENTLTPDQIYETLPEFLKKDIKYSLRRLREKGVIKKLPNLHDMRRVYYRLATLDEFATSLSKLKDDELEIYKSIIRGEYVDVELFYEASI